MEKLSTQTKALKYIGNSSGNILKENESIEYARQVVNNELFPHMGLTSTVKEKGILLGHIIHKLISTMIGIREPDDRDNYINKRVDSPGTLCYDLFRQLFKKYTISIINSIEKRKQFPDILSIIPRQNEITKGFLHCFSVQVIGVFQKMLMFELSCSNFDTNIFRCDNIKFAKNCYTCWERIKKCIDSPN